MSYFSSGRSAFERQAAARYDEWLERPFKEQEEQEIPEGMTEEEYEAYCDRLDYEEGMREMAEQEAWEEARNVMMFERHRRECEEW